LFTSRFSSGLLHFLYKRFQTLTLLPLARDPLRVRDLFW